MPYAPAPAVVLRHAGSSTFNQRWLVQLQDETQVECVLYRGDTLCVLHEPGGRGGVRPSPRPPPAPAQRVTPSS